MDFPAYIPSVVREHLAHYLEGEIDRDIPGYAELLTKAELALAEIERAIECSTQRGEVDKLSSLRKQRTDEVNHRDALASDVDCLRRLAHDPRMRDLFALIAHENLSDQQLRSFIHSAWSAKIDYRIFRERLKRATELKDKISDAANTLAKLIRQFEETHVNGPDEFHSIPALLRKTENTEEGQDNAAMWRSMRKYVLGESDRRAIPVDKPAQSSDGDNSGNAPEIVIRILESGDKPEIDPVEQARDTLRYVWGLAPPFSSLLETVAKAAQKYNLSEYGAVGAAIDSRQHSLKTEYLRAFAYHLSNNNLVLTNVVLRAMAIISNVVINMPDVDVTYDDARKALAKQIGNPLENSIEK